MKYFKKFWDSPEDQEYFEQQVATMKEDRDYPLILTSLKEIQKDVEQGNFIKIDEDVGICGNAVNNYNSPYSVYDFIGFFTGSSFPVGLPSRGMWEGHLLEERETLLGELIQWMEANKDE